MNFILILLLSVVSYQTGDFRLQNGDLIFQESCAGDMGNAIKTVTTSVDQYHFTHVGIVYIAPNDSLYVLEATHPQVVLTPIHEYLYPADGKGCYPVSVVGRLKPQYQPLISEALKDGFTHIGKYYDDGFVMGNDKYYCSELIYDMLLAANKGVPVFDLNIMTFKDPKTGQTADGWKQYFDRLNLPVPEGEPGINPGAMSRADVIDIVHRY